MKNEILKIVCPHCLKTSEYELPANKMIVNRDDFTDDLLNQGYTKGYQQGRADAISEFKQKIIEYSGEHFLDCDGYYGCNTELVFRVDEWLDDIAEQIKE